jgi:hypothetical protein
VLPPEAPDPAFYRGFALSLDFLCLNSEFDYDPVWAKCAGLKVVPGFRSTGFWGSRTSLSNFMYNHIGHFALRRNRSARACSWVA